MIEVYRLLDPGSEWRLHRQWFEESALGDLLGEDLGLVQAEKVLLIDLDLCTRCGDCERACADTHDGISRLTREGPSFRASMRLVKKTPSSSKIDAPTAAPVTTAKMHWW